jgi:glucose-1-phosphate cytidylyltransferase
MASDIHDWRITFVETGANSNIGQRLKAVEPLVRDEPEFLANYTDGLTDLDLPAHVEHFRSHDAIASFLSVRPNMSYHVVSAGPGGRVTDIEEIRKTPIRVNGGFFVMRPEIFSYMRKGEELVIEPFQRLVRADRLATYVYDGFWMPMDTFKDRQQLEDIYARGTAPWEVWKKAPRSDSEFSEPAYA